MCTNKLIKTTVLGNIAEYWKSASIQIRAIWNVTPYWCKAKQVSSHCLLPSFQCGEEFLTPLTLTALSNEELRQQWSFEMGLFLQQFYMNICLDAVSCSSQQMESRPWMCTKAGPRAVTGSDRWKTEEQTVRPTKSLECRLFENLTLTVIRNDASINSAGDRTWCESRRAGPCGKPVWFQTLINGVIGKVSRHVCVCCSVFVLLANESRLCHSQWTRFPAIHSGATELPEPSAYGVSFLPIPFSHVSLCIKPLRSTIISFQWAGLLHRKGYKTRLCRCFVFCFFLKLLLISSEGLCVCRERRLHLQIAFSGHVMSAPGSVWPANRSTFFFLVRQYLLRF